jgi:hypothetical protein
MTRPKGTPNKRTVELVTEFGNIGVIEKTFKDDQDDSFMSAPTKEFIPDSCEQEKKQSEYIVCEGFNPSDLCIQVMDAKNHGYHCVGGIAIHDIRNPLNNEYEPHFYQAMERME